MRVKRAMSKWFERSFWFMEVKNYLTAKCQGAITRMSGAGPFYTWQVGGGIFKVIEFLTVLGADVNAIDTSVAKTTPLIEAARAGKREACEVLIKHGANVRFKDAQGDTAIHWAARRGWGTLLKSLIHTSDEVARAHRVIFYPP